MSKKIIDFEEKLLDRLPPGELSLHLMRLPAKKRLEAILRRTDAEAVVAAMAEQDFYYSVKEIGIDDALPLLSLAQVDQLNHLFDLEWWQKDQVQPARAVDWLDRLAQAGEGRLLEWLYQADFELLVTLFKGWLRVSVMPEDIDPLEARDHLPKNTLDDQYFWEARYPQYEDFLAQFLNQIYQAHYGFYKELMNQIVFGTDAELEEDAFRFHRGRLEDRAIPDFYEALEIYRNMSSGEIRPDKKAVVTRGASLSGPCFALAMVPEQDLLGRALREIEDPSVLDTLQLELASLANKVMIADQLSPDSPEFLHFAVDKATAYVNLGLQLHSAGMLGNAVDMLKEVFLEHLFRLGHTQVSRLGHRLQEVCRRGWLSRWPKTIHCLDMDWMVSAELMLRKTPRLLRGDHESQHAAEEDLFRSQADISRGGHFIDVVVSLGPLFDALAVMPGELQQQLWQQGLIRGIEDVTLGVMIWTAAANFLKHRRWEVSPLPLNQWPGLFPLVAPDVMEHHIRSWVEGILPEPADRSRATSYLNPLLRAYAEETNPFLAGPPPDPKLVRFFLFAPAQR